MIEDTVSKKKRFAKGSVEAKNIWQNYEIEGKAKVDWKKEIFKGLSRSERIYGTAKK